MFKTEAASKMCFKTSVVLTQCDYIKQGLRLARLCKSVVSCILVPTVGTDQQVLSKQWPFSWPALM